MLNDDLAWELEEAILREYQEIEAELFQSVIKALNSGKRMTPNDWRIKKLADLRSFSRSWERQLQKLSRQHQKAIEAAIEEAIRGSAELDERVILQVFGKVDNRISMEERIKTAIAHAREQMNLTNTQAIARVRQDFIDSVNAAYLRVYTGTGTLEQGIRKAANDYAKQGLTVHYISDSGRVTRYNLADSVRRDIVTTINQTATEHSLDMAERYGTDLVEVSAHSGARPDHALWQGKVYSISGRTPGYRKLSEATGYGTATGLCGVNCRHTFWPYFAGYSKQQTRDDIPGLKENEHVYNLQQQQRAYERTIRTYKRQAFAAKETGDEARRVDYSRKLNATRSNYLDFLRKHNLTRYTERENPFLPSH